MEEDIYEQYKDILEEKLEIAKSQKQQDDSGTDYRWCDNDLFKYSLYGIVKERF